MDWNSYEEDDIQALVYDVGSGVMKLGFAGDDAPRAVFPTIIGKPRHNNRNNRDLLGAYWKNSFIGEEAQAKRGYLTLSRPLQKGKVLNYDDMKDVLHHCPFNELCVSPEEHPLLLSEKPGIPKNQREKMAKMQFETFGVPKLAFASGNVLSMYASGSINGLSIDFGEDVTTTQPVYEGYGIIHAIEKTNIGGNDITNYLTKLFLKEKHFGKTNAERNIIRDIKEKSCFVAEFFKNEQTRCYFQEKVNKKKEVYSYRQYSSFLFKIFDEYKPLYKLLCPDIISLIHEYYFIPKKEFFYELPDGKEIKLEKERFTAPELLFQPSLNGIKANGVHEITLDSIKKVDKDLKKTIYQNIILSGGNSIFFGIDKRLKKELDNLLPNHSKVRIIAPAERKYSVWIGGSILASSSSFKKRWMTRKQYEEFGTSIVHRLFFS